MASQTSARILVVDDDPSVVRGLMRLLRRDGYTVDTAENGHQALALLPEHHYDVILCDLRMPELNGQDFYAVLRRDYPSLCQRVMFVTGDTSNIDSLAFLAQCGQPWMAKPCTGAKVRSALAQMLDLP